MEITTILWREWLFLKRRFWRVTFSQMVSPLLYFVTFGMGLGRGDGDGWKTLSLLSDTGSLSH